MAQPLRLAVGLLFVALSVGCQKEQPSESSVLESFSNLPGGLRSLRETRQTFRSKLEPLKSDRTSPPSPPEEAFRLVRYPSQVGELAAYLSPDPQDGKRRPAIVWITGGDYNSIGECWLPASEDNDQTAAAYRLAGIIMMFPSLRGGNDNPGNKEGFYGEVEDVLSAADFLEKQPYVDPKRIYLGGHSTGGTLALLTSEYSDRFRAVFSFGPADYVSGYGYDFMPYNAASLKEIEIRSPGVWLASVKSPTYVLEGTVRANTRSFDEMARSSTNPALHFIRVTGADHFNLLAPANHLFAERILRDDGPQFDLGEDEGNLARLFAD